MSKLTIVMPELGESVAEATLSHWSVREGDTVRRDQTLAEASTDKADTELPSPAEGRIVRLLLREGETVKVGTPIAELETGAAAERSAVPRSSAPPPPTARPAPTPTPPARRAPRERLHASPLVRRIARESSLDLAQIQGSGAGGRITKNDLLRQSAPPTATPAPSSPEPALYHPPPYRPLPGDQRITMSRRRRLIAEHMVYSKQTSPHVPCLTEVDLQRVQAARAQAKAHGDAPSLLAYVATALVQSVADYPIVNATVLDGSYVLRGPVHLGIAVDTEEGLVVPVIRDAQTLSTAQISRAIAEQGAKARKGALSADELAFGTITLSNPGSRGNVWGAAIIPQPQVAIVRMGEVIRRPVVIDVDGAEAIAIRPIVALVLSYDHRIIDGVAANGFLRRIKERLEALA